MQKDPNSNEEGPIRKEIDGQKLPNCHYREFRSVHYKKDPENLVQALREEILLFTNWRDERSEVEFGMDADQVKNQHREKLPIIQKIMQLFFTPEGLEFHDQRGTYTFLILNMVYLFHITNNE